MSGHSLFRLSQPEAVTVPLEVFSTRKERTKEIEGN
jgi:hypothetical protein